MRLPPKSADTLFEEYLQGLPGDLEASAREFKAFTRGRKIKSVTELWRVVFLYCGPDQTLREVAGTMTLLSGEPITDMAILGRLRACEPWVKALLSELVPASVRQGLPAGLRFRVMDGSSIQGPGAQGTWYRLHVSIDLVSLAFDLIKITDARTGESLQHFELQAGEVAVTDRGYNQPQVIIELVRRGVGVVIRLNPYSMPLFDAEGERLELATVLRQFDPERRYAGLAVQLGSKTSSVRAPGWVHAYRLSPEQAAAARRRCCANAKKGKPPTATTLYLAGWVLVFTSLSPELLSTETVLELYRLRWQVELAIKRWKSLLNVDALRAREGSPLASLWLHGKLLYAVLLERRAQHRFGLAGMGLDSAPRQATWWRPWKLIALTLIPVITGVQFWRTDCWDQCARVMQERPRRRKLQTLPNAVQRLRQRYQPVRLSMESEPLSIAA